MERSLPASQATAAYFVSAPILSTFHSVVILRAMSQLCKLRAILVARVMLALARSSGSARQELYSYDVEAELVGSRDFEE